MHTVRDLAIYAFKQPQYCGFLIIPAYNEQILFDFECVCVCVRVCVPCIIII